MRKLWTGVLAILVVVGFLPVMGMVSAGGATAAEAERLWEATGVNFYVQGNQVSSLNGQGENYWRISDFDPAGSLKVTFTHTRPDMTLVVRYEWTTPPVGPVSAVAPPPVTFPATLRIVEVSSTWDRNVAAYPATYFKMDTDSPGSLPAGAGTGLGPQVGGGDGPRTWTGPIEFPYNGGALGATFRFAVWTGQFGITYPYKAIAGKPSPTPTPNYPVEKSWCNNANGFLLASIWSTAGVTQPPTKPSVVRFTQPVRIKSIMTYHWNVGATKPRTIALKAANGRVYGPWRATGAKVVPAAKHFCAYPNIVVPAGKYTVIDSVKSTWSQVNGPGMLRIWGSPTR